MMDEAETEKGGGKAGIDPRPSQSAAPSSSSSASSFLRHYIMFVPNLGTRGRKERIGQL